MKQRCHNPKSQGYSIYGGRGIIVCDEWRNDPEAFFKWAEEHGYKKGVEIDRENTNGNYEPGNCRFVTPAINAANRRYVKLNNAVPDEIRALAAAGFRQRDIWLLANSKLTRSTITMILNGKIWKATEKTVERVAWRPKTLKE